MAQFQIVTPDEPTMFGAAQALGFIPAAVVYAPGLVGTLTGGALADGVTAWAANLYGVQETPALDTNGNPILDANGAPTMTTNPGFYGILDLPDAYTLPGDTQTLASRVIVETFDPGAMTTTITCTPFTYGPVTITTIPANSPVRFS